MTQISSQPVEVFEDSDDTLRGKIRAYIDTAKEKASDGITVSEFSELLFGAVRLTVVGVEHITGLTNAQKKSLSVNVAGDVFDAVAALVVPLPLKPLWWLIRPAARALCISLASGLVEGVVPIVPRLDT
mgnify:CR=1 FL=1|tara:strand:+ start:621 stop:1007 length:387 start_codon:yes stop_codon:yes gene_type:complete